MGVKNGRAVKEFLAVRPFYFYGEKSASAAIQGTVEHPGGGNAGGQGTGQTPAPEESEVTLTVRTAFRRKGLEMKKQGKQLLGIGTALAMLMSMQTMAFAATFTENQQDESVLKLESKSGEVLYKAVTVEGGYHEQTQQTYPDVTTYSYYIALPEGSESTALETVQVSAQTSYTLKVDGASVPNEMTLDFTGGAKTLELYDGNTLFRTYQLGAGIVGKTLNPIVMRINVQNAVNWASEHEMKDSPARALSFIKERCGMNESGEMGAILISDLPTGSTAMDAFYALCRELGLEMQGTGEDGTGHYTYISKIGDGSHWLGERDTEGMSGWLYLNKNGQGEYEMANYGAAQFDLMGGEDFVWLFTNNYGDFNIVN